MQIREATLSDAGDIAKVHVDAWRSTYRGLVPDSYLSSLSYDRTETMTRSRLEDPEEVSRSYVAENESGHIIGFAVGGPNRGDETTFSGELWAIYVLKEYQAQGTGRALVLAVARGLLKEGMRSMIVWVLKDNPSRGFYEHLGGTLLDRENTICIEGTEIREVAYGWHDLPTLLSR